MRLISKNGWSIVPKGNSFLYYEMGDRGEEIGYFRYSFDNISEIDKDTYSEGKYGLGYRNILKYFEGDAVAPSSIRLEEGAIIVKEFKDSYIYKFDEKGELLWINASMGEYNSIYGLAYQEESLWCVYPTSNEIKKFSLNTFKEEISIGEPVIDGIFSFPEFAIAYGNKLYVCDMGNYRICIIDLNTNEVKEYLKFNEPTWEYLQINGKEIVRLQSGIYILG